MATGFKIADAYVDVEVDEDALDAGIADVEAKLAAIPDKIIKAGLDAGTIPAQVAEIMAELKGLAADIPANLNEGVIDAQIASLKAKFDALAFDIPAGIDEGALDVELADILAKITALRELFVDIPVNLDLDGLTLSAAKAVALLRGLPNNVEVTFETDDAPLVVGIAKAKALLSAMPGTQEVVIRVDDGALIIAGAEMAAFVAEVETLNAALDATLSREKGPIASAIAGWTLFGQSGLTALHWIVAGTAELLAVLAPAVVAMGAWFAVWLQGAVNVYEHMQAVYGATEATANIFGVTAGQAVGLGHALQTAQNAANPDVYQALGAAVDIVREHFSDLAQVGLEVGRIFDTYMAKLVYDFSAAGGAGTLLNNLLSRMIPDLVELGQVFGGLGHEILLLAGQMPGLAEALLYLLSMFVRGVVDITEFLSKIQLFGVSIVTAAIGLEEFMRWGGLLVGMLGAMGSGFDGFTTKFLTFTRLQEVFMGLFTALPGLIAGAAQALGDFAGRFALLGGEEGPIATALGAFSTKLDSMIGEISFGQAVVVTFAAIAMGILIDKLVTAQSAAQQFVSSLQDMIEKASNLGALQAITQGIGELQGKIAQATQELKMNTDASINNMIAQQGTGRSLGGVQAAIDATKDSIGTYTAAEKAMGDEAQNVIQGAQLLANTYHISLTAAMALATAANVNLAAGITGTGEAADVARIKIMDLVQGYQSMGAPIGAVGNDILALGIQSGLAGTKVEQLEQAWQQFMTNLTGGTTGLADFEQGLKGIQTAVASVSDNLSSGVGLSASVSQVAHLLSDDMAPGTTKATTAWQNFNQVVGSTAPQMINWFQTAGAEGAISGKQFTEAVATMISQLLPFAADSNTATAELSGLAQMMGGPATDNFQTLKGWVDSNRVSTAQYNDIVDKTTIAMSNMSQIAQNLGTVLQSEITNMMDTAKLATSGADGAINTYTKDLENNTQNTDAGKAARAQLIADLEKAGLSSVTAEADVKALTQSVVNNTDSTSAGHAARNEFIGDLGLSGTKATDAKNDIDAYTTKILSNSTTTAQGRQDRLNLIADLEKLGINAKTATTDVDKYTSALKGIPKGEETTLELTGHGNWTVSQLGWALTHPVGSTGTGPPGFASGWKVPGYGGGDIFPALLEPGEAVVSKEHTKRLAGIFKAIGVPGFASGGATDVAGLVPAGMAAEGAVGQTVAGEVAKDIWGELSKIASTAAHDATPGLITVAKYAMGQGATRAAAAGIGGTVAGESGGNPEAVQAGGGGGEGIIQWTPGSSAGPIQPIITGNAERDMGVQLVDMMHYIAGRGGLASINAAGESGGPLGAAYRFSAMLAPLVPGSDVRPSVVQSLYAAGYANGGVIPEPVVGMGLHSGTPYTFAENGPETVVPGARQQGGPIINFYGTQYPTTEQIVALKRQMALSAGVGP
jgi:hypothetical protein